MHMYPKPVESKYQESFVVNFGLNRDSKQELGTRIFNKKMFLVT